MLLECKLEPNEGGGFICQRCGKPSDIMLRRRCRLPGEVNETPPFVPTERLEPGLLVKAWNYTKAIAAWRAAGSPVRPQPEIDRIFAICEACRYFADGDKPRCKLCGCSLGKAPDGLVNKIAMDQTEHCPLDPPKW